MSQRRWNALSLLSVEEVSVRFGGVMALQDVDLTADPGRVTGLIGPNGAGKTTLFNVITGLQDPTSGKVLIEGEDVSGLKAHQRARMGLARTFQRLEVFGSLTARENVLVAAEIRRRWAKDGSNPREVAETVLERVGITSAANERGDAMPTGLPSLVQLARDLHAAYGRIEVLHGVDLVIPEASVFALLGPNGAGKTTTLKTVDGRLRPTRGCVHVADTHVNGASSDGLARAGLVSIPEGRGV